MWKLVVFHSILYCSFLFSSVRTDSKNYKVVKCLVCQKLIEELKQEVSLEQAKKRKVAVTSYNLDGNGDGNQRVVPHHQSDVFLTEVMDGVCEKMKDYVRGHLKSNNKLVILPLVLPGGQMNPEFQEVNPIYDDDLNRSLGHYCQEIISEYEEEILERLKSESPSEVNEIHFCESVASYCVGLEEFESSEEPESLTGGLDYEDKDEL